MSELNPIAGAILQSIHSQRESGIEKERQVRRAQVLEKDVAARDDRFEHQVESSDAVPEVGEEERRRQEQKKRQQHKQGDEEGEPPHIDLSA